MTVAVTDACDPFAGAAFDPPELFDVDVDELAGAGALVAHGLLEPDPAELASAVTAEDR